MTAAETALISITVFEDAPAAGKIAAPPTPAKTSFLILIWSPNALHTYIKYFND